MFERLKRLLGKLRESYRMSTDADYAYLNRAQDTADLERRMRELNTRGTTTLFYTR